MGAAVRRGRRPADCWAAILSGWTPSAGSGAPGSLADARSPAPLDGGSMSSGSQKRKVTARIAINCTPAQKAAIMKKVEATGLSPSAMCLAILLDVPLPRRRVPTVNDEAMRAYLAATAAVKDVLRESLAELGKSGSNLNQIAYMLNANTAPPRIMNIIESALQEHHALVEKHQEAFNDLDELRTLAMQGMGLERARKPPA